MINSQIVLAIFQPTMQVEPPLLQIQNTTTLRPFKNSVCEKTLKYLMLSFDKTFIKPTKGLFVCNMYKFCQVVFEKKISKGLVNRNNRFLHLLIFEVPPKSRIIPLFFNNLWPRTRQYSDIKSSTYWRLPRS